MKGLLLSCAIAFLSWGVVSATQVGYFIRRSSLVLFNRPHAECLPPT